MFTKIEFMNMLSNRKNILCALLFFIYANFILLSCGKSSKNTGVATTTSDSTNANNTSNGTIKVSKSNKNDKSAKPLEPEKIFRPNMVLIEGGRFLVGSENLDFESKGDQKYTATVESFYMDETEIANVHWLEYLFFIRKKSDQEYLAALPDTLVWNREFSFNDFYVESYLRHPAFRFYPVVGVTWLQANEYCKWRSDPLIRNNAQEVPKKGTGKRIQLGDSLWVYEGYRTPKADKKQTIITYRLPTEAEWIYAAGTFSYHKPYLDEKDFYKRIYPWDGTGLRNPHAKKKGNFFANFKRGRGDYSGVARSKNDGATYTEYIFSYPPNDVGLYNIAGNVNEWVSDLYDFVPTEEQKFEYNKKSHEDQAGNKVEALEDTENDNFQIYLEEQRFRVYKGGSWNDVAYWLSPSTRRFWAEDSSSSTIGFRCVLDMVYEKPLVDSTKKDSKSENLDKLDNSDKSEKIDKPKKEKKSKKEKSLIEQPTDSTKNR